MLVKPEYLSLEAVAKDREVHNRSARADVYNRRATLAPPLRRAGLGWSEIADWLNEAEFRPVGASPYAPS